MKLPDLRKINPNYSEDARTVDTISSFGNVEAGNEDLDVFKEKWITCTATLTDWIKVGPINVEALIASENLTAISRKFIKKHQIKLYKLWLETFFQLKCLREIQYVLTVTPLYAPKYAQIQLNLIGELLNGKNISKLERGIWFSSFEQGLNYKAISQTCSSNKYEQEYDIYAKSKANWLELLLHYKAFLEKFINDPTIERPYNPEEEVASIKLKKLFPKSVIEFSRIYVLYQCNDPSLKEEKQRRYDILQVNECHDEFLFRAKLQRIINEDYQNAAHALKSINRSNWKEYLAGIIIDLVRWRAKIIADEDYKQDAEGYREERYHYFKRLNHTAFIGNYDAELIFDGRPNSTYKLLLMKLAPYANVVFESINSLIRRLEDDIQNLDRPGPKMKVEAGNTVLPRSFVYRYYKTESGKLKALYNSLKDLRFIVNTSLITFKRVFTGMNVETRINWRGGVGSLCYFIKQIHDKKKKIEEMTEPELWATACHCFGKEDGEKFEYDQLRKASRPKSKKVLMLLDEMVDQL